MKLKFDRLEHSLQVSPERASFFEVRDRNLFARVVQSFEEEKCDQGVEPYSIWNDDGTEKPHRGSEFLLIDSLPRFPLSDRKLITPLMKKVSKSINADLERSSQINALMLQIENLIESSKTDLQGSYDFELDCAVEAFMKALSFGTSMRSEDSIFDKGIAFLNLYSDIGLKKVVVFVNAKSFFYPKELQSLINRAVFLKIPTVFLESWHDGKNFENSTNFIVDQHFLELV